MACNARTLLLRKNRYGCAVAGRTITHSKCLDSVAAAAAPAQHDRCFTDLDGPKGVPVIGNFHTYIKAANRNRIHEVQVSTRL